MERVVFWQAYGLLAVSVRKDGRVRQDAFTSGELSGVRIVQLAGAHALELDINELDLTVFGGQVELIREEGAEGVLLNIEHVPGAQYALRGLDKCARLARMFA